MSWVFQYAIGSHGGRVTRRIKIGDYPALSPAKARQEAEDLHAKVHLHGDPALQRRKTRLEASKTFGRLVVQYLQHQRGELRPRSFREIDRHLDSNARPLHDLPLASIDRETIARLLSQLAPRGRVVANRTRASLSAMFTWAMGEGLVLANPVIGTNVKREFARDRVLTARELHTIWHALPANDYGTIVKILALTGQRAGEIGGLRWSEVDFERAMISLPGERTKNARTHEIPMACAVLEMLGARERRNDRDLVFGVRGGPWGRWAQEKALLDARVSLSPPWRLHDLRRTCATGMADIGVQPHIIEAVLNHVSGHKGGVAGIYNRASYGKEKAEALARWDEHVRSIVGERDQKVVGLRGRS
jgi:integrase